MFINPVLNKEFKLRFRSPKSFFGILFYLLVLGLLIFGFMYLQQKNAYGNFYRPDQSREMFMMLSFLQLTLIFFITPGLTAGVISSERERQTLNIMLTTSQSSASIILSKLVSSLSFLLLLIVACLPLYCIVFLFGGISPSQVVYMLGFYIFTMFVFGSIGVMFSTLIRKTIVSMVTTYGVALFLTGGTGFMLIIGMSFFYGQQSTTNVIPYLLAMTNPVASFLMIMEPNTHDEFLRMAGLHFPIWGAHLILYTIIAICAVLISIYKLRPKMKSKS